MTACGRIVVTAGPTISAADIRSVVPDAEVAPPIAFGQALSYDLRSGDTLLIVDGLFFQQPSVRHKELLTLMADGVRVVGSSSMGALRAAELHPFGMEGYGWVFESYRDGVLEADDEVGVVHGDADDGYPVFVDALVNMRHTLARAVATGVVCSELAERIIETARATPFTMRTWARLLSEVGAPDQRGLAAQLRSLRVDVKHADALLALRQLGQRPRVEPLRPGPPPTVWYLAPCPIVECRVGGPLERRIDRHASGHRKQRRHPGHGVGGRADRHRAFGLGPGGPLHHRLGIEPVGNRPGRGGDPRITHPVQCGHVGAQLGVECAAILDVQAGRLPHDQRGPPLR